MNFIIPAWLAPPRVRSLISTRKGGRSESPFASFNTALHVGDKLENVQANRAALAKKSRSTIQWLEQVHGSEIYESRVIQAQAPLADGAITRETRLVCAVQTADCLPVLLCDKSGTQVAAIHAGWRGLAAGILGVAVARFEARAEDILAYLGPAISQDHFEVGDDVLQAFLTAGHISGLDNTQITRAFQSSSAGKYHADMYALAKEQLHQLGLSEIYGGDYCTFRQKEDFYSYRRDGVTGRMASLIWLEEKS